LIELVGTSIARQNLQFVGGEIDFHGQLASLPILEGALKPCVDAPFERPLSRCVSALCHISNVVRARVREPEEVK
jgi:hypothetical protein